MRSASLFVIACFALACSSDDQPTLPKTDVPRVDVNPSDLGRSDVTDDTGSDVSADTDIGLGCEQVPMANDSPPNAITHTPKWAFEPWISKDISDRDDTFAFVQGFKDRDIPVGVVVLDSPWETHYNTFIPNPDRYQDFSEMVSTLRADGVRTVLWTTQMVNTTGFDLEEGGDIYDGEASNYEEGARCGFFIDDNETYLWWKGLGSAVDFFNPDARIWWHRQQDALLEMGVAGWKLDFGESYITGASYDTFDGERSRQEYSEAYYKDFYDYGAAKVGTDEFVTMVRGYDKSYQFEGRFFARPEDAPVIWAGDNRRDWVGLADALDHMFRSAQAGYVVVGSDIGGYLDVDDLALEVAIPFDYENFMRWVAVGALSPFMQLHGRGNLTPWTVDGDVDQSVDIYRYWSVFHTELIPFWFSESERAYQTERLSIMTPLGDERTWENDYRYMLGDAWLVAPLVAPGGRRDVELPEGRWTDWWSGTSVDGPTTITDYDATDLKRIPLFLKDGAIVPVTPLTTETEMSTPGGISKLHFLIVPSATPSSFTVYETANDTTLVSQSASDTTVTITIPPSDDVTFVNLYDVSASVVRLNAVGINAAADVATLDSEPSGFFTDVRFVRIKVPANATETTIEVDR